MIITFGEALIDMVPVQYKNGREGFQPLKGGAIFNTAISLGRLGSKVGIVSGISTDIFGQQLVAELTASNVDISLLIRSNLPTTLAFVKLTDGHVDYTFYDENSAGRCIQFEQISVLPEQAKCLYFGGISLINEPCAEAYCKVAEREAGGRLIMLDPNIRPGFVDDEKSYRLRLKRMIAVADIVKVSDEDLDWLIPDGADILEKVLRLRQCENKWVVVTRGGRGCIAYGPNNQQVEQTIVQADVIDTVGAGDTFNSGFLASLDDQKLLSKQAVANLSVEQVKAALQFSSRVAAVTVSRAGANSPWRKEL